MPAWPRTPRGSNLGDLVASSIVVAGPRRARDEVTKVSSFHETAPRRRRRAGNFLNAAAEVHTFAA